MVSKNILHHKILEKLGMSPESLGVDGLTAEVVAGAHKKDLEKQGQYGVKYLKYWYNEKDGAVFCLSEAPDKDAALRVHEEAHGLIPDEIIEVKEGV